MTKTKFLFTIFVPSTLSGFGTYELLRSRGSGKGSQTDVLTTSENENHSPASDSPVVDPETDMQDSQDSNEDPENKDNSTEEKAKEPSIVVEPKVQTYLDYLTTSNKTIRPITATTESSVIKNVLLHRMFPHYKKNFSFSANQMFTGSPQISFKGQEHKVNDKSLFILGKNEEQDVNNLRQACVAALDKPKPTIEKGTTDPQLYKLKAWCTEPTIKDVLNRHKFTVISDDAGFKEILDSEWIKDESNHNKQTFFTTQEMSDLKNESDEAKRIKILRDKCKVSLDKPFERTNFPATKDALNSLANLNGQVDEFQEAALFCTKPITAETYVTTAMQGVMHSSLPKDSDQDYCYVENKTSVDDYKNIQTTDSMGGKSFWCAVKLIYYRSQSEDNRQKQQQIH